MNATRRFLTTSRMRAIVCSAVRHRPNRPRPANLARTNKGQTKTRPRDPMPEHPDEQSLATKTGQAYNQISFNSYTTNTCVGGGGSRRIGEGRIGVAGGRAEGFSAVPCIPFRTGSAHGSRHQFTTTQQHTDCSSRSREFCGVSVSTQQARSTVQEELLPPELVT